MSTLEDTKSKEIEIENQISSQQLCLNKNWVLRLIKKIKLMITFHQHLDQSLVVGEYCLKQFLDKNPNSCPVESHDRCQYTKVRLAQRYINGLKVICPLQFEQELQTHQKRKVNCDFNGKIKELKDHLEYSCPLKLSVCWFKPFGCDHKCLKHELEEHLISKMKFHFDLVMKSFKVLKQIIQSLQYKKKKGRIKSVTIATRKIDIRAAIKAESRRRKHDAFQRIFRFELKKKKQNKCLSTLCATNITNNEQDKILLEIEKLKKDMKNKIKQVQIQENTNQKIGDTIKSREKLLLEKGDEIEYMKKIQTIAEIRNEISLHCNQNSELTQDYGNLIRFYGSDKREEKKECSFDLFRSANPLKAYNGHTSLVYSIDYSQFSDGQFLCSGSLDKTIKVWDVNTAKILKTCTKYSGLYCVKFSPYHYHNGGHKIICSTSTDNTICFWNFENSKETQILEEHDDAIYGIHFSPFNGGQYLCSASADKTVCLWDIETSRPLHFFKGHEYSVRCAEFSPLRSNCNNNINSIGIIGGNGYTICSGSYDKTIRVWDLETLKELVVFRAHQDFIKSVKYSPYESGGNIICSGSNDKSIRLWDIRSKKEIQVLKDTPIG
ncbi:G-protein beta WD-40 repeats containing protein [Reticulomyxa filosa]|uniref:G-protein beta WD-40 repeats containing protein n=1 Tax=Reticulomyxa filosa TaxID=46433 RepID=X6M793_RETFI|nr:G-protein beta WD-40 repeats containing protein [Reticulomyxa filosa]|eukprot:ETO09799.1 G-protein beta WD-40 repeats containing protein [Reticulomyxa filosa]